MVFIRKGKSYQFFFNYVMVNFTVGRLYLISCLLKCHSNLCQAICTDMREAVHWRWLPILSRKVTD
jgi:hypothetical protein